MQGVSTDDRLASRKILAKYLDALYAELKRVMTEQEPGEEQPVDKSPSDYTHSGKVSPYGVGNPPPYITTQWVEISSIEDNCNETPVENPNPTTQKNSFHATIPEVKRSSANAS